MNLYLDFDGVIVDTIKVTYKMIEDSKINIKDKLKVNEFYRNLDWFELLKDINQINNSIEYIKEIQNLKLYNLSILTSVNSLDEIAAKKDYIRRFNLNLPIISVPIGTNKNELVEASSSILVDDYSGNLYPWEEAGGIGVKFSEIEDEKFITINSLDKLQEPSFTKKLEKRLYR